MKRILLLQPVVLVVTIRCDRDGHEGDNVSIPLIQKREKSYEKRPYVVLNKTYLYNTPHFRKALTSPREIRTKKSRV